MKKIFIIIVYFTNLFTSELDLGIEAINSGNSIKAKEIFLKSCENGDMDSCNFLGSGIRISFSINSKF